MNKTMITTAQIDPLELPERHPPSVPLWAENYVYEINCPDAKAAFFMHLARQPFNTDLWRDTFVADLGGDEVYLWKGFGKGAHAAGPSVIVGVGAPNHFMLGPALDSTARGHLCATPTQFRWNGETCYGYSEQTAAVGEGADA